MHSLFASSTDQRRTKIRSVKGAIGESFIEEPNNPLTGRDPLRRPRTADLRKVTPPHLPPPPAASSLAQDLGPSGPERSPAGHAPCSAGRPGPNRVRRRRNARHASCLAGTLNNRDPRDELRPDRGGWHTRREAYGSGSRPDRRSVRAVGAADTKNIEADSRRSHQASQR